MQRLLTANKNSHMLQNLEAPGFLGAGYSHLTPHKDFSQFFTSLTLKKYIFKVFTMWHKNSDAAPVIIHRHTQHARVIFLVG